MAAGCHKASWPNPSADDTPVLPEGHGLLRRRMASRRLPLSRFGVVVTWPADRHRGDRRGNGPPGGGTESTGSADHVQPRHDHHGRAGDSKRPEATAPAQMSTSAKDFDATRPCFTSKIWTAVASPGRSAVRKAPKMANGSPEGMFEGQSALWMLDNVLDRSHGTLDSVSILSSTVYEMESYKDVFFSNFEIVRARGKGQYYQADSPDRASQS